MSRHRPLRRPLLLALPLFLGTAAFEPLADDTQRPPTTLPALLAPVHFQPPASAVTALRRGRCVEAERELAAAADADAAVLAGLYAHSCRRFSASLDHLLATTGYSGPLADWRLRTLAESAVALGQLETAQTAYTELADLYPDSPLSSLAVLRNAELAVQRGDPVTGRQSVERGRRLELSSEMAMRLEVAAWSLARGSNDEDASQAAARRLLRDHPPTAARLEVVELFRGADGALDWPGILGDDELEQRAERLLGAGLFAPALETLAEVTPEGQDLDWLLLRARALTLAGRGKEAHHSLADLAVDTAAAETRVEWLRAQAALEASVARRGRRASSAERRSMRQLGHAHLRRVVALGGEHELVRDALRILFEDRADSEPFEESLEVLRALKRLHPQDATGAHHLWLRGWKEYERRNYTAAIGYWTELRELYPSTTRARSALYWSATAHRALGHRERSQELLTRVASAPQADFYRRHAMQWLERAPAREGSAAEPPAPWPDDPLLTRARWLSDIGLDELARSELDLMGPRAERRAAQALLARILARQGETRQSIIVLRRAFPELGTHRQHLAPVEAQWLYYPRDFRDLVTSLAERRELSPHLVFGMIRQESAFDAAAHSWAGARGLMQVMPATGREWARRLGLSYSQARLHDPAFSVQLGTAYYQQVLRSFGDQELALAGYNAGPTRIRRLWSRSGDWDELDHFIESLPFEETKTYVKRVVLFASSYERLYADRS